MIGTGIKKEPSRKTNPYKAKNAKGQSFKVAMPSTGKDDTDSGGSAESRKTARRMVKGMKPAGPGVGRTTPESFREKNSQGQSHKTVVAEWCEGKRKSYRA